jgi:acyl-coenzyme A synthetase/AMP-(fatty) acid ligase
VRRLPDAQLGFLGRIDDQLEVHGHRIEPGEIEHALRRCAGVTNAAVGVDGTDALVGYVVAASWDPAAVRDQLAARLPARMVPTRLVPVAALPLTARGKLDRAALRTLG